MTPLLPREEGRLGKVRSLIEHLSMFAQTYKPHRDIAVDEVQSTCRRLEVHTFIWKFGAHIRVNDII